MAMMENVLEHLAHDLGMDPLEIRLKNMLKEQELTHESNILPTIVDHIKASSQYEERLQAVADFNGKNKWKKRGLSLVPLNYIQQAPGAQFNFQLAILRTDGTVKINCGAIEIGQGINTKVVQTVAKELGISMDLISLKPADNMVSPNNSQTWGSWTTDAMCSSAKVACKTIKDRLQEVAVEMDNPTWLQLIQECYKRGVDLTVHHL